MKSSWLGFDEGFVIFLSIMEYFVCNFLYYLNDIYFDVFWWTLGEKEVDWSLKNQENKFWNELDAYRTQYVQRSYFGHNSLLECPNVLIQDALER